MLAMPFRIPVPWDPIYERDFSRIIQQLGARYARDPLCVSVVLTCANFMSAEMHLPKTRPDLARWQSLGDYQGKLLDVYKKYTDEWAGGVSPAGHLPSPGQGAGSASFVL